MTLGMVFLAIGLIFVYFEFFMPNSVMATGGIILLFSGIGIFFLQKVNILQIVCILIVAILVLLFVVQFALWKTKKVRLNVFFKNKSNPKEKIFYGHLVGRKALATTDISPCGKILIDGTCFSAFYHGGEIKKGNMVEVIGGEDMYLIISPLTPKMES